MLPGQEDSRASFATGVEVNLNEANLYSGSAAIKEVRQITGKYYIWNATLINNRVRITDKFENVGQVAKVTGWIDYSSISNQFKK